jgi:ribosomal protein S20
MRETIKEIKTLAVAKDQKAAAELLPATYKAIDKAAKRGVIKPNTASRKKSLVARIVKEIA